MNPKIVYRADVQNNTNNEQKFYFGMSETPFKNRFENHKRGFSHSKHKNSTDFSKYIWYLKDLKVIFTIISRIIAKVKINIKRNYCKLGLSKKLCTIKSFNDSRFFNEKSELVSACRHKNKLLLKSLKRNKRRNDIMDRVFR